MDEVRVDADSWVRLKRCRYCGQHWQVDEADKYHKGICIKIDDPDDWSAVDVVRSRKAYILANYGGPADATCAWSGCTNKAMRKLAFCVDCAYEHMGIRY